MQTTIETTKAIISSIKRDCSARLYFFIKNQIKFYLKSDGGSLVTLYALSWSFEKGGGDFERREEKIIFHFGATICLPGRRIIKLFKALFHIKLKN